MINDLKIENDTATVPGSSVGEVLYNLKVGKDFPIQPKSRVHEKKFTTGKFKIFSRQRRKASTYIEKFRILFFLVLAGGGGVDLPGNRYTLNTVPLCCKGKWNGLTNTLF